MSIREAKGRDIADRFPITRKGNLYLVPSQSGSGKYTVNPETGRCSCPDYDIRRQPCKHFYAVQVTVERERKTVTETKADGATKTTVTERVTVKRNAPLGMLRLGGELRGQIERVVYKDIYTDTGCSGVTQ